MQTKRQIPRPAKWAAITLAGIFLFLWGKGAAHGQRGYAAAGGEYLFLLVPLVWWLIERTWKDHCRALCFMEEKEDQAVKLNKIGALLKKRKAIILYDAPDGTQWIGDGNAAFPLFGLPRLEEENIYTLFDISEKQQAKMSFQHTELPQGINFKDTDDCENKLDDGDMAIGTAGITAKPLQTQKGMVFIDTAYLAPVSDVLDMVDLYERFTPSGTVYIAVKAGLMLAGVVMPQKLITKEFVEKMEEFLQQCRIALEETEREQAAQGTLQTTLD